MLQNVVRIHGHGKAGGTPAKQAGEVACAPRLASPPYPTATASANGLGQRPTVSVNGHRHGHGQRPRTRLRIRASGIGPQPLAASGRRCGPCGKAPVATGNPGHGKGRQDAGPTRSTATVTVSVPSPTSRTAQSPGPCTRLQGTGDAWYP